MRRRAQQIRLGALLLATAVTACRPDAPEQEAGATSTIPPSATELAEQFHDPPRAAAPLTWWHWMNGNVSEAGITADLEAMRQIGLRGAIVFSVGQDTPPGDVPFGSPAFYELAAFAVREAKRLGLEIGFHSCDGWSASGGPWITPEMSMKMLTAAALRLRGPAHYDRVLPSPPTRAELYGDIATLALPLPDTAPAPMSRRSPIDPKGRKPPFYRKAFFPIPSALPLPDTRGYQAVPAARVVDLTARLDPAGRLRWEVPAGRWLILRVGYTTIGRKNRAATAAGRGYECDKLDPGTVRFHFDQYLGKLVEVARRGAGSSGPDLTMLDSFEAAQQNWTDGLLDIFERDNGYDITPYLPGLFGFPVDGDEVMEKVFYDWRRTIAHRMETAYFARFAELAHEAGMRLYLEPYGPGSYNYIDVGQDADRPTGEFWVDRPPPTTVVATSTAHTYGKPIVSAEAFTQGHWNQRLDGWQAHPALLKPIGDRAWALGINEFLFHRFVHQPNPYARPGLGMGRWGMHMDRTQTWWPNAGRAWVDYIRRGQLLLRQGLPVADLLRFAGDGVPIHIPQPQQSVYKEDVASHDVVLHRLAVDDGRIVLPDGTTYRLLTLPQPQRGEPATMLPATLHRLHELVADGMTLYGPPPVGTPSMAPGNDWGEAEDAMVEDLWGAIVRGESVVHRFGRGEVVWGIPLDEALARLGVEPDLTATPDPASGSGELDWVWTHRADPLRDIYFVANTGDAAETRTLSFRIAQGTPAFWYAETGAIEPAAVWRRRDGRTEIPLELPASASVFVIFDHIADPPPHLESVVELPSGRLVPNSQPTAGPGSVHLFARTDGGASAAFRRAAALRATDDRGRSQEISVRSVPDPTLLAGPWRVTFSTDLGGPGAIELEQLLDWTHHPDDGVRYYSGTATYERSFELGAAPGDMDRLLLDLGEVHDIAEVSVDGAPFVTLWKPPFELDLTGRVHPGPNRLTIRITNTWVNRLIGDERLYPERYEEPVDPEWGTALTELPAWYRRGEPPPADGPVTFTSPRFHAASDELLPAGLIGPVRLVTVHVERLGPAD